jgi:hypothetical protein
LISQSDAATATGRAWAARPRDHRREYPRRLAKRDLIEADLQAGNGAVLVAELERLVRDNPLRERLLGQLMLALYRAGRHPAALEAYRSARRTLAAELGLDPGPQLQELERRILEHDPSLNVGVAQRAPERAAPAGRGRRRLTAAVAAAVAAVAGATLAVGLGSRGAPDPIRALAGSGLVSLTVRDSRIAKDVPVAGQPVAVAVGSRSLWLADAQRDRLLRVDQTNGGVIDSVPLPTQPGAVAVGGGAVWVAGTAGADIVRVDGSTGAITQQIPLPSHASGLASAGGRVWVLDAIDTTVMRLDAGSGTVARTLSLGFAPSALTAAPGCSGPRAMTAAPWRASTRARDRR